MKLLYVASNRPPPGNLDLEAEITELQRLAASAAPGEQIDFVFLPSCKVDQLANEIQKHKPDVLHISCHGSNPAIELANSEGGWDQLDASRVRHLIGRESAIKLIYISSCNSQDIAKSVTGVVPLSIGTTARIADTTARAVAVMFYRRIFEGETVTEAFDASTAVMSGREDSKAALHSASGIDPGRTRLYAKARVLARFVNNRTLPDRQKRFELDFGLAGCPETTNQVVFFTDDPEFISKKSATFTEDLAWVSREQISDGIVWEYGACDADSEFRLVACAITKDGRTFSVVSSVCDALRAYYTQYAKATSKTEAALKAINKMQSAAIR